MKKVVIYGLITIVVFIILSLVTAKCGAMVCGNNTIGFSLTFYTEFGGKRSVLPPKSYEFNYSNLIFDVFFATPIVVSALVGINSVIKLMNRKKI